MNNFKILYQSVPSTLLITPGENLTMKVKRVLCFPTKKIKIKNLMIETKTTGRLGKKKKKAQQ